MNFDHASHGFGWQLAAKCRKDLVPACGFESLADHARFAKALLLLKRLCRMAFGWQGQTKNRRQARHEVKVTLNEGTNKFLEHGQSADSSSINDASKIGFCAVLGGLKRELLDDSSSAFGWHQAM